MRSLSQTSSFQEIEKMGVFGIVKTLKDNTIPHNFSVDKNLLESQMLDIRNFKYPLLKYILNAYKSNNIGLILLAESKIPSVKPIEKFPLSIASFKLSDGVCYTNISARASYIWNTGKTEVDGIKLTDNEFYAYAQSAYLFYLMSKYDERISSNIPLVKDLTEIYTRMFTKFLDRSYPITNDRETLSGLMFLVAKFFIEYCVGLNGERAVSIIKQIRDIDKTVLNMVLGDINEIPTIDTVETFITLLKKYFPHLRDDSMNKRQFIYKYTSMYGANAIFAIEHPYSFINMIFTANMRIGLYNDRAIDSMAQPYIEKLEKTLAAISATV